MRHMLALTVVLWFCAPVASSAVLETFRDFDELYQHILLRSVVLRNVHGTFTPVAHAGGNSVAFWVFDPPQRGLAYHPANERRGKRGFFEVYGQRFYFRRDSPAPALESLKVSEFEFSTHHYLCLEGGGTGLYRSGTWQQVVFVHLFDVTHPKRVTHYPLYGRFASCRFFGDLEGDGTLGFPKVQHDTDQPGSFRIEWLKLSQRGFQMAADQQGLPYVIRVQSLTDGRLEILGAHWPRPLKK